MKNELNKVRMLPLNIQLFAEPEVDEGKGTNPTPPATSTSDGKSETELRLEAEIAKQKKLIDTYSAQIAEDKKKAKAKMSEEEQAKVLMEEKDARLAELERKVASAELSTELTKGGFEEQDITDLVEAILNKDNKTVAQLLVTSKAKAIEKAVEDAKKEFQAGTPLPGQGGSGTDQAVEFGKNLRGSQSTTTNTARDLYGKKQN